MPWSSIANNQTISRANLQDAINQGYFTLKAAFPSDNKQITKDNADAYINIPDAEWPGYTTKSGNQLLTKYDLPTTVTNNGTFTIDAQYGITISSITGTGLPTLPTPVSSGSVTNTAFNYTIPSQTLTVNISGSPFFTPLNVALYVNSSLLNYQTITTSPASLSLSLTTAVYAGETIRVAINSGAAPPSPSFTFQNQTVNNVLISKSGTYGLLTTGRREMTVAGLDAVTASGLLYVTSNGGASWTNTGIRQFWTSIASSDNGQYMIAVGNNGYIFTSTNFGTSWTQRTSAGKTNWNGCCAFNNGVMVAVSRFGSTGNVYRSTDAFATFSNVSPLQSAYVSVACGTSYGNAVLTDGYRMWYSSDYANTWTELFSVYFTGIKGNYTYDDYKYQLRVSSDGSKITLLRFYSDTSLISASSNYGSSFSTISGSSVSITSTGMWMNAGLSNASSSYYTLCPQVPLSLNTYPRTSSSFGALSQLTSPGTAYWQAIDVSNGGGTILLGGSGGTSGLFRSTNSGSSFTPI
jgi:hypothetical protein